jgi:hypothetical protein
MYAKEIGSAITMSILKKCADGSSLAVYRTKEEQLQCLEEAYAKYKRLGVWSAAAAEVSYQPYFSV